jgi:hypothetical protein
MLFILRLENSKPGLKKWVRLVKIALKTGGRCGVSPAIMDEEGSSPLMNKKEKRTITDPQKHSLTFSGFSFLMPPQAPEWIKFFSKKSDHQKPNY